MKSLYFISLACLTVVQAVRVTFKVIAPDTKNQVFVKVDNVLTQLNAEDPQVPYYVGSAELNHGQSYNYVMDNVSETFERVLNGFSTKNEFFGRPVTYSNIPELPSILSEGSWTRGSTEHPIWDSRYVPSIFVTADPDEMNTLIEDVTKSTYKAKITFIGPDSVDKFEGCTFGLHRPGRKNNDAKQSWIWTLPEGQFLAHRNWFKLRHMEEDPTQQREKLYADILRKMGTYANEANMVRFFINKEGMGTFNMLDDVSMYSYINAMFYHGETPEKFGGLFDGASGASFNYPGDFDSFIPNFESPVDQSSIEPFARAFHSVDFKKGDHVKEISEYFDYDQFLRFMVMEFLTGDWDGYWQEQTNDGVYLDFTDKNRVYYLGQDFDGTFGINLPEDHSFVNIPYTDYPKRFPNGILINRLLENPSIKATFEHYLKTTVLEVFNGEVLGNYLNARYKFLAPDLEWDRSIKQRSPGNNFGWTFEHTQQNLYEGVTGTGKNSGGADWGLLEWIEAKEKAVKSFFKIADDDTPALVIKELIVPEESATESKLLEESATEIKLSEESASEKDDVLLDLEKDDVLPDLEVPKKKLLNNLEKPISMAGFVETPTVQTAIVTSLVSTKVIPYTQTISATYNPLSAKVIQYDSAAPKIKVSLGLFVFVFLFSWN